MLLPTEWEWLVKATLQAGDRFEMTAQERCLVYRVAIQTGLRVGELRSLTRGSFYLNEKSPYIKAESGSTKNRQVAYQYIDSDLANDLKALISTKLPTVTVFPLPQKEAAKMLQADLEDARGLWLKEVIQNPDERAKREQSDFLKAINDSGAALDFHALRHTCGAWLAIRRTEPKVIQSVMRHSTITLTLDTYGHLLEGAQSAAINHAADMTAVPKMLKATGTDTGLARNALRCGVRTDAKPRGQDAKSGGIDGDSVKTSSPSEKPGIRWGFQRIRG